MQEDKKTVTRRHGPTYEKPKNMKKTLIMLYDFSKKLMPLLIISILCAALSSIFSIIAPNHLTDLVNALTEGVKGTLDLDLIKSIAVTLITIYILSAVFNLTEGILSATVANKLAKKLRTSISTKINKLPLKYFDKNSYGDILSRVTNDVDMIGQSISQSLGTLIAAIALFLGSLIMMFATNVTMALTGVLSSSIGFVLMSFILSKSQKYFLQRQEELGKMNGHIEEIYSNYTIVRSYNGVKSATKRFDELNESLFECNRKSQFLSGLMQPIMNFIGNFAYVAVCIVGAVLTMKGSISFGVIVAFIVYVRLFTNPLSQIAQGLTSMQSAVASVERVFEFLNENELLDESTISQKVLPSDILGKVEFKNVKFGYDEDKLIIKDFTLKVMPGEKIAIVGPTGAGKTTLVNLLMKFYELNGGDILVDDISIKDMTRENVHDLFTMVLQDTWLFEGTIRDNIKYNKENVSDSEIISALKTVGLGHFIKSLPNGLDTLFAENDSVSAGQRQLLTIARGMIKNAPLLILDEATSNVDTRTEELVQKAMDKLTEGRTSFIIAHRLSTIKNADKILVLKDGNIVEIGNHDELIMKNGFYAELYNSQFEL